MNKIRLILMSSVILFVVLDQLVKEWARNVLLPVGRLPGINGLIGFRFATNTGAAFGVFQDGRWFFIPFTIVVLAVIFYYEFKLPYTRQNMWVRIPFALIVAGALGNFIDRLLFGYVVDMFEFLFISFPIFNVADILLVTGTVLYAFAALFILKDAQKDTPKDAPS